MDIFFHRITEIIQLDSDDGTREVSAEVSSPDEINDNINPTITYGKVCLNPDIKILLFLFLNTFFLKAGSVVKMASYILGDDTFRRGLTV